MSSLLPCCFHMKKATLKLHVLISPTVVTEEKHPKCSQRESPNPLLFLSTLPEESVLALTYSSVTTLCVCFCLMVQMEQAQGSAH